MSYRRALNAQSEVIRWRIIDRSAYSNLNRSNIFQFSLFHDQISSLEQPDLSKIQVSALYLNLCHCLYLSAPSASKALSFETVLKLLLSTNEVSIF